ncbi:hypothetical protein B296_00031925 [Ensete ventricosum]|uniref:Uncharacterized protein n=1 Tax=Ensete ventricosum TaxID=4639 RepID=A0A427AEY2_ENSVE|nr:hypothetical protein B296_00031925 [Ensete ventricosum]
MPSGVNCCNGNNEIRDSPEDSGTGDDGDEEDDSDGLPQQIENASGRLDSSFKMLCESIQKCNEIYEKMQNHKRQQMAELERMKEFQKECRAAEKVDSGKGTTGYCKIKLGTMAGRS